MIKKIMQKVLRGGITMYPYCPDKRYAVLQNVVDVIPLSGGKCKSELKKYYWFYKYRDQHIKDMHRNSVCVATKCPIVDITKVVEALIKRHLKKCAECKEYFEKII